MNRRELIRLGAGAALGMGSVPGTALSTEAPDANDVEQWGTFEAAFRGPSAGNPFIDTKFRARFTLEHRSVEVAGFYDGDGTYRVRFMPDMPGWWSYETDSNVPELR